MIFTNDEDTVRLKILTLFKSWAENERKLLAIDYDDSVLKTLDTFNLSSLKYNEGYEVLMQALSTDNEVQGIASRMRNLEGACYLHVGKKNLEDFKKHCYDIMHDVYDVNLKTIDSLKQANSCLWICVLFRIT